MPEINGRTFTEEEIENITRQVSEQSEFERRFGTEPSEERDRRLSEEGFGDFEIRQINKGVAPDMGSLKRKPKEALTAHPDATREDRIVIKPPATKQEKRYDVVFVTFLAAKASPHITR